MIAIRTIKNSKIYKRVSKQLNYRPYKRYFSYKRNTNKDFKQSGNRMMVIDINHNPYQRYLFNFCFFFTKEGYTIFFKNRLSLHKDLYSGKYSMYIYSLPNVLFVSNIEIIKSNIQVNKNNLNFDYFKTNLGNNSYKLPMSMHPDTYLFLHGNRSSLKTPKKRLDSIFFTGNFNKRSYSKISKDNKFKIINRYTFVQNMLNNEGLNIMRYDNNKAYPSRIIVFNNSEESWILKEDYLNGLHKFRFFLCLPGVAMPFSHNLIEAMYCGCIPILQNTYANLLNPPLKHKVNALIFSNFQEFIEIYVKIDNNDFLESELESITQNVISYYNNFLSIKAVTFKVIEHLKNDGQLILMGSHNSVKLL